MLFSLKLLSSKVRSILTPTKSAIFFTCNVSVYLSVTNVWSRDLEHTVLLSTFVTVFYECNTIVRAMECNRSMRLRKVRPQCNTVVHVKRSVCDSGHAFTSKKRKAQCTAVGEPENAMKC